ncbi:MAG: efflux RND transporter periplasmic adaptor subunit [Flexilinea sp.]
MDHKIETQKRNRKPGCIIALLILIIVLMIAFAIIYYTYGKQQAAAAEVIAESLATVTTKIKQGNLSLTLEDITGTVRSDQSVELYWQTSGTIGDISVEVGDTVKKGDILAVLDPETLDQDVINAELDLSDAQDAMDELLNNASGLSEALSALVTAQQSVEDAQTALDSMDLSRATDLNIDLAYETYLEAQNDYESAVAKFETTRDYDADDATRIKRLGDVSGYRSVRDNALAQYTWYLGQIDELERQTREATLILAKATLEEKQYQYEKLSAGPTEANLNAAQAAIDAAQTKIDSSKIIAPFAGTVTEIEAKTNDVVSYDSTSAQRNIFAARIDDISTFYIDFSVSELYINDVTLDQPVQISFTAIPDKVYNGVVTNISDTGATSGRSVTFGVAVAISDADEQVKSGMTADIKMDVNDVTDALYAPQTSVILDGDKYFVNQKMADGTFEEKEVTIGLITGANVQIFSDELKAGDEIELDVYGKEETETFGFPFGMMGGGGGGGEMPSGGFSR